MSVTLEDTVYYQLQVVDPATQEAIIPDALPTVSCFENADAASMYAPTVAQRGALVGNYVVTVEATTINGFSAGNSYNLMAYAVIAGKTYPVPLTVFQVRTYNEDTIFTAQDRERLNDLHAFQVRNMTEVEPLPGVREYTATTGGVMTVNSNTGIRTSVGVST